jgi:DNA-binding CsgD family transcriptional regulator
LTRRQAEILGLVAQGATNQEVAARLMISEHTVAKHLENAYRLLGVRNRTAAIAAWRDRPAA